MSKCYKWILETCFEVPVREPNYSHTPDQRMIILFYLQGHAIRIDEGKRNMKLLRPAESWK